MYPRNACRVLVLIVTGVFVCLGLASQPASAWGDKSKCSAGDPELSHTNRWSVFLGHHMDVQVAMCQNLGRNTLDWTQKPHITFPSRGIIGATESISLSQQPFISQISKNGPREIWAVDYKFSVLQCVNVIGPVACNDFDFIVRVAMIGSRIWFVGGSSDDLKTW